MKDVEVTAVDAAMVTCVVQRGMVGRVLDAARETGACGAAVCYCCDYEGDRIFDTHAAQDEDVVSLIVPQDRIARMLNQLYGMKVLAVPRRPISVIPDLLTYPPPEMSGSGA